MCRVAGCSKCTTSPQLWRASRKSVADPEQHQALSSAQPLVGQHQRRSWTTQLVILVSADVMSRRSGPPTCQDWVADRSGCTTAWRRMCTQQAPTVQRLCHQHGVACHQHTGGTVGGAQLWCRQVDCSRRQTRSVPVLIFVWGTTMLRLTVHRRVLQRSQYPLVVWGGSGIWAVDSQENH